MIEHAIQLARALDAEDYDAAAKHLAQSTQEVSLDKDGFVSRIRHIDLEGDREALQQFEARHRNQTAGQPMQADDEPLDTARFLHN